MCNILSNDQWSVKYVVLCRKAVNLIKGINLDIFVHPHLSLFKNKFITFHSLK